MNAVHVHLLHISRFLSGRIPARKLFLPCLAMALVLVAVFTTNAQAGW